MYKLFLCLRYLRKRRIAFFAIAAVCLCVAMVLIVVSVMSGFLQMVSQVSEATPVIISYGVLRFLESKITKPVQIVGIRLDETYRVNEFKSGLFYEKYYPGSTSFADQQVPGYGLDQQ